MQRVERTLYHYVSEQADSAQHEESLACFVQLSINEAPRHRLKLGEVRDALQARFRVRFPDLECLYSWLSAWHFQCIVTYKGKLYDSFRHVRGRGITDNINAVSIVVLPSNLSALNCFHQAELSR
eukprot:gnl/TRDRNA2_/TRDRNA2_205149_c0_seq1.p1 gnl/TRDRNA2_/TRDRNA2_205149_c0~~gnl/TRDRNA2_/TRDRNA2_205149_c0_seq1.p1  ORF type:complete len:125 (-),score=1.75 gnl/TRDRNA2_/TRDRNA2_205149_c0_seq1:294-668(-)